MVCCFEVFFGQPFEQIELIKPFEQIACFGIFMPLLVFSPTKILMVLFFLFYKIVSICLCWCFHQQRF